MQKIKLTKTNKNKKKSKNKLLLKTNKNFTPCNAETGDEIYPNGIFEFNITKMIEFIENNSDIIPVEKINVKEHRNSWSHINEDHMNTVNISKPIILAEICPKRYNIIDGHHRIEKAYKNGIDTIAAYKIKTPQHLQFLITKKGYIAYIEYWNEKVLNLL